MIQIFKGSPSQGMSLAPVCPPSKRESAASSVTVPVVVAERSGIRRTRSARGVYKPDNHLAWLQLSLQLFPDADRRRS